MEMLYKIAIFAPPVLLAITLHEVAHGWAAKSLGDPTAHLLGRLTLNPLKHVDPVGTILIPLVLFLLPGNFLFGWAKPVPVNMNQLGEPKRDMALVAAAGPAANFVMALLWAFVYRYAHGMSDPVATILITMAGAGILFNLVLMVVNLIPVPPLDGGRVLAGVLPNNLSELLARIEPFGLFVIFGLLAMGMLGHIIYEPLSFFHDLIFQIVGIPAN